MDFESRTQEAEAKLRQGITDLTKRADDTNLHISSILTSIVKLQNRILDLEQKRVEIPAKVVPAPKPTASLLERFKFWK